MNLLLRILAIAALSTLGQQFMPWWIIVVVALLVETLFAKRRSSLHFFSGFYGVAIPWMIMAIYFDVRSDSLLTVRMLEMFNLPPYGSVMVIITGLLGGVYGGLGSLLGGWIGQLIRNE